MPDYSEFLKLLVMPTSIVGGVTYLAKLFIESKFRVEEKIHMASVQEKIDIELHKYKAALELEGLRQKVKVSGVYEKQSNCMIQLYQLITDVELQVKSIMSVGSTDLNLIKEFDVCYIKMHQFYERNKILIPKKCTSLIDAFIEGSFGSVRGFISSESRLNESNMTTERIEYWYDKQNKAIEIFESIPKIKHALTDSLREQIGAE